MPLRYKNEHAFSRALVSHLRSLGYQVTPIETGGTMVGVPDLFVTTPTEDLWIELKRVHGNEQQVNRIPWRPGQQSWMLHRYKASRNKRPCATLICYDDVIVVVPMIKHYSKNFVLYTDVARRWNSMKEVKF